jgi:hypothetical protein
MDNREPKRGQESHHCPEEARSNGSTYIYVDEQCWRITSGLYVIAGERVEYCLHSRVERSSYGEKF